MGPPTTVVMPSSYLKSRFRGESRNPEKPRFSSKIDENHDFFGSQKKFFFFMSPYIPEISLTLSPINRKWGKKSIYIDESARWVRNRSSTKQIWKTGFSGFWLMRMTVTVCVQKILKEREFLENFSKKFTFFSEFDCYKERILDPRKPRFGGSLKFT